WETARFEELGAKKQSAPHARSREESGKNPFELESELEAQLNAARTAAYEERIADADVACGGDWVATAAHFAGSAAVQRKTSCAGVRDEGRQEGVGKIGVIENVEKVGAELHAEALRDCGCLINREVPLLEGWAM